MQAERTRWAMSVEARGLTVITAVLAVFGLATLYSASAIVAMQEGNPSTHYFFRQAIGMAVGVVVFAISAKVDAERLRKLAWPMVIATIVAMLLTDFLPLAEVGEENPLGRTRRQNAAEVWRLR